MSCWVLSENHINTICSFVFYYHYFQKYTEKEIADIGKILSDENLKSYKYRYPNCWEEDLKDFNYQFKLVNIENISLIQFIKFLNCLEYQSCEHRSYEKSFAYLLLFNWRAVAFQELQNKQSNSYPTLRELVHSATYDQAEWAI